MKNMVFQCPYCKVNIEDKNEKYLRIILFRNVKGRTKVKCICGKTFDLYYNDMNGELIGYKTR
jgi:hypothetical protein